MAQPDLAYVSFDTVPAPKGAAIHIEQFTRSLAQAYGSVQLVTVSPSTQLIHSVERFPGVTQVELPALGEHLIARILHFRTLLESWWPRQFTAVHFRSICEGYWLALDQSCYARHLIFEVNGLPSIEWKYRYPQVAEDPILIQKLLDQEQVCLEAADLILTPSAVTVAHLESRGISAERIRLIPNGVDLNCFTFQPVSPITDRLELIYFGTLSAWQGVELAIEALALIQQQIPAHLTIVGSYRPQQARSLEKLAHQLGVNNQLTCLGERSQPELVKYLHQAHVVIAPLTANDRNLIQGCCPLKLLEGMASGTPVVTSDLPVVREVMTDEIHGLLVKPGSAKAIRDAVLRLTMDPSLATHLSYSARQHIEAHYTWKQAGSALVQVYQELGISRAKTLVSNSCS